MKLLPSPLCWASGKHKPEGCSDLLQGEHPSQVFTFSWEKRLLCLFSHAFIWICIQGYTLHTLGGHRGQLYLLHKCFKLWPLGAPFLISSVLFTHYYSFGFSTCLISGNTNVPVSSGIITPAPAQPWNWPSPLYMENGIRSHGKALGRLVLPGNHHF